VPLMFLFFNFAASLKQQTHDLIERLITIAKTGSLGATSLGRPDRGFGSSRLMDQRPASRDRDQYDSRR
jgi:hypothetical protein